MKDYIQIGTLVATHGTAGELVLRHNLGKKSAFKGIDAFFVETLKDQLLPYFPQQIKIKNEEEVYIKFDGLDVKEKAASLLKKKVWLPENQVSQIASKSAPISLLGYEVIDRENSLGNVLEVIEQPQQLLLRLMISGKEVLVPLNESTLRNIHHDGKKIYVELPDGLLEVYLGESEK